MQPSSVWPWDPSSQPTLTVSPATTYDLHCNCTRYSSTYGGYQNGTVVAGWPVIKVQSTPTALDVWLSSSSSPDQVERRWIWFIMDLSVYLYLQQPWWRSSCGKIIRSMGRTKLKVETEETVDGTLKLNKQHVNQAHPRQVHEFGMQSSARGSGGENSTPDQKGRQILIWFLIRQDRVGFIRIYPGIIGRRWSWCD